MVLKAGAWVEVRTKEEILQTLDHNGRLDEMPFMPEMFEYCGKRFQVQKRAHKTCDPIYSMEGRKLPSAVHLPLRCNGKAHGGCKAGCAFFWREEWLKPVDKGNSGADKARDHTPRADHSGGAPLCSEETVWRAARADDGQDANVPRYSCQTTELPGFTRPLSWWNPSQYIEDYLSGNETLGELFRGWLYSAFGRKFNTHFRFVRSAYNGFQLMTGGMRSPVCKGKLPIGAEQPRWPLDLQPGDFVRIKPLDQILATIDQRNKHKGLFFDVEMVPYCGRVVQVRTRVDRFIDERTGLMRSLKTPAVILETVWCRSRFSTCRMFCPRALYSWWREEWLERVEDPSLSATVAGNSALARSERDTAKRNEPVD